MTVTERYLTVWVLLCIVAGILSGQGLPAVFEAVGRMEIAKVNIPVVLLIWVMIIPMLVKVDFGALHEVRSSRSRARHLRDHGSVVDTAHLCRPVHRARRRITHDLAHQLRT